jgi:outer membrane immunogenic protein
MSSKIIGALVAAFAASVVSPSFAAELPMKAPAATLAYDWSGFYIGANIGYGSGSADWTNQTNTTLFGDYLGGTFSHNMSGKIGGAQLGYNLQRGPWVYGLEATFDFADIEGDKLSDNIFSAQDDLLKTRIESMVVASARLGYAWDKLLTYGKVGFALAKVTASAVDNLGPSTGSGSDSQWRSGWALGAGFEYGLSPNLSVGLAYDYIHLGSGTYELGGGAGSYAWDVNIPDVNVVTARLNYRFGSLR